MKHVVFLGGGFANTSAIVKFLQNKPSATEVIVIDRNAFHTFNPSLYEVATSEQVEKNIAIPYYELFGNRVTHIKDTITKIDVAKRKIFLESGDAVHFDYLVIGLGSQPAYFNIPGLKENSIPLKSINDAVNIKEAIVSLCCKGDVCNKKTRVVIGGGGFAGTELAAEMLTFKNRLAKQHNLASDCLEIDVIQGSDKLLKELDEHVGKLAMKRIRNKNVRVYFGEHIKEVTNKIIKTDKGNTYPYDLLIWTGGVESNSIAAKSGLPTNKRGQILVNDYLQVQGHTTIFAAGDDACYINVKTGQPVPGVAQVAYEMGDVVGENLAALLHQNHLKKYQFRHYGYVIPLRGHFSAAELMGRFHLEGVLAWILQQIIFLRYLLRILPLTKAVKRWNVYQLDLTQSEKSGVNDMAS